MGRFEPVAGKYVYLEVQGVEYRVYFEENGQGIPLVCQHTAGTDGRQWRHIINDEEITARYKVIVPDLPYHGKSLPPESVEWWKEEYKLTRDFFLDFHVQFCDALKLERPVYIGSSMGGHLALDLALERPHLYRAVVGVQAGLGCGRVVMEAMKPWMESLHHPRISDDYKAACMLGLAAPASPEKYRREISWEYGQNAPPVFKGDMYYFIIDHDLTDGMARQIDTSRVSVYLLTGEYDPITSPKHTQRLAQQIRGAQFTEMKGLGHFAVCENYEVFKKYLMPVLNDIAG